MSDIFDVIIRKMNDFGNNFSKKSNVFLKKAVNQSEKYANRGIEQIENEKLKWKLKKEFSALGEYIYKNNTQKNMVDYSDDEKFILLIEKIKRIDKLINKK